MAESIYIKILYVIASYLLGSVVFGYVMARIYGGKGFGVVDRPGTAGAGRMFGKKASIPTFLFDFGKGIAVALIGRYLIRPDTVTAGGEQMSINIALIAACLAVLIGHNWPVWYKFRGGGGLATAMGIGIVLVPIQFFIIMAVSLSIATIYRFTLYREKHKVNPNVIGGAIGATLMPIVIYFYPVFIEEFRIEYLILFIGVFIIIVAKGLILHFMYRKVPTAG
jgi:glycerol-3-phosphate acyltransferase PlsY